jgi:predicted acylesterase/phospholipase RssA
VTAPLGPAQAPPVRYTFDQLAATDSDDDLFICLTFSGGGTRAAALAYGVLQKLRDTAIVRPKDGRHEALLDDVDCISSVSGGSFTAAYYALFGPRIFQDYRKTFLDRDVESDLFWAALNPLAWPRLLSPYFSRIDLASELYGNTVFENKSYTDLLKANRRPFIILNSTDLTSGDDFEFTQDQFDLIGSDLAPFPVARAVAASSAFPFLLTPVSLVNNPQPAWFVPPKALAQATRDYYVNRRRFVRATNQLTYLDKTANPYIHVMDGGLADNIGLRALTRQLWEPGGFIARRFNLGKVSKLVFIVVNAKSGPPQDLNKNRSPPGLVDVAFKTATVSMDNYNFEIIELLRDQVRTIEQAQRDIEVCKRVARSESDCPTFASAAQIHVIDIALEAIPDPAQRARLLGIGTNFGLPAGDVQALIDAAGQLLDKNPDFQKLLKELHPQTPVTGDRAPQPEAPRPVEAPRPAEAPRPVE